MEVEKVNRAILVGLLAASLVAEVTAASQLQVKWAVNTSDVFQARTFGAGHMAAQTVWDVDGDGTKEVVFGTRRGDSRRLWCFDAGGNFEWIFPPISQDGLPGDPTSKVSLVDVNDDGTYELCFAARTERLYVLNGKGSVFWIWDNPNIGAMMYGPPQAYDVDGDGFVELFLADSWGYVHRIDHEGEQVWALPLADRSVPAVQPTIADIDRDGECELLLAAGTKVYCINARTPYVEWSFDAGGVTTFEPAIVADVNGDGEYEALIGGDTTISASGAIFCLNYAGMEIWRWELPDSDSSLLRDIRHCQSLGDVDGDGRLEMVVMSYLGVFCLDVGGESPTTEWQVNLTEWSEDGILPGAANNVWSSYQLIADVDGDGGIEVLLLAPFPIALDGATGVLLAHYVNEHLLLGMRAENGGWWGDVDGDGVSEWVCELQGVTHPETQVYCLTMGGAFPAESPWPEYYCCAYPASYQSQQAWLTLKGAYSNSLWFPIPEALLQGLLAMFGLAALRLPCKPSNIKTRATAGTSGTGNHRELEYADFRVSQSCSCW